mmetsp:Transcript_107611/g.273180  ORF Transcript_107611/g.273180 Transcript_107611/m.273180 type:complete len:180 (+) Transcript_107611:111-650(+)
MSGARLQVIFIGLLAFCGPGLFNALRGLGNAGADDPSVAAIANSCLYLTFAVSGYFAAAAFNLLGPIPLFVLGGLTYAIYAACIFFSPSHAFLPVIGGIILGVGAGIFWTAQSSLMMMYATPNSRGMQSLGAGCAWFIDLSGRFSYREQGLITLLLAFAGCLPVPQSFRLLDPKRASEL